MYIKMAIIAYIFITKYEVMESCTYIISSVILK